MQMSEFTKSRKQCFERDVLFEDDQFAAIDDSVFYHDIPNGVQFTWKRPLDIVPNPKFVTDDQKQFDITHGRFGPSWFTSVLGVLYQYRGLFYRTVPADQGFSRDYQYAGIFHFHFWWCGEWTEVIVDDRLPCLHNQLGFTHTDKSHQFWASLLEKAYAKLHGSYEALKYTSSVDVFNELTGGTTDVVAVSPDDFCIRQLHNVLKMTTIVTATSDPDKLTFNGLQPGRHYCISALDVVHVSDGSTFTLVKLRLSPNVPRYAGPWGSSDSPDWKQLSNKERDRLGISKMAPNEFWIDWKTFCATFDRLEIVYLDEDTYQSELRFRQTSLISPHTRIYQGFWKKGSTAGGCRNNLDTFHVNPQLLLEINQPEEVLIALLQHNVQEPRVIGFSLYKITFPITSTNLMPAEFFRNTKAYCHSVYSNSRQVVLRQYLDQGFYIIMPTTYDAGQEGTFTLRIYSIAPISLSILDAILDITKSPVIIAADAMDSYRDMFMSFADENKTINAYELQELLHNSLPNDYMKSCASLDVCKRIIAAFQPQSHLGRICFEKFKDFLSSLKVWQEIFGNYSKSTSGVMKAEKLREALNDVGFQLNTDLVHLLLLRYMRRDGTLRFGDFVACILHLICSFNSFTRKDTTKTGTVKLNSTEV